jgi:RNA polymerase sigma-70 factor (ECF subfamily)
MEMFRNEPERALEIVFREYYPDVCRSVLRIIPDAGIAEDIAQDVFYDLWRKREKLNINTSFGAYLRRAARNKSLNYIRDRKINPEGEEKIPHRSAGQTDANRKLEIQDLERSIDQAVGALPERCRQIFSLSRFEEMTYQEIADQLGISIKTVENQISKALRLLREALGPHLSWFVGFITFIFPL